ncbi:MAG TPA: alpha/beta hydrolase [bacterium]|nr:alpha/beta hydrolase [bacterium]
MKPLKNIGMRVALVAIFAAGLQVMTEREGGAVIFEDQASCEAFNVPVSLPGVAENATIYGELCRPQGAAPDTVQLLVHSTWYNHREWDPPQKKYSHVRAANNAGFATFNIDRLGTGRSSHPPSHLVTPELVVDALHQVILALRAGELGGHAFSKVVWIGSSFGSEYGWINAFKYPGDIDAFVLNGLLHFTKATFADFAIGTASLSVCQDPVFKFIEEDCGYITNKLGMKGPLYYYEPEAAPGMLEGIDDIFLRDMVSANLLAGSLPYVGIVGPQLPTVPFVVDPETSPSRAIQVPTLIVLGDRDQIVCGPPDGLECTRDNIFALEAPYFGVTPDVYIAPNTGHAVTLHKSGPQTYKVINDWIAANL